jgi:hypothetical protein
MEEKNRSNNPQQNPQRIPGVFSQEFQKIQKNSKKIDFHQVLEESNEQSSTTPSLQVH